MSEDNTNAFVAFFSKIAGDKDYWIFWVAISIAAWVGFVITFNLWLLLVGIATTTVIVLTVIVKLYRYYKNKKHAKLIFKREQIENRLKQEQAAANAKAREDNRKKLIWRYIAHINQQDRMLAACILNYPIHDDNKYTRFVKNSKYPNDDEGQLFHAIWSIVDRFRFVWNGGISKLYLMERQQIREGFYVTIDPYLYDILEHYKDSHKWEKL